LPSRLPFQDGATAFAAEREGVDEHAAHVLALLRPEMLVHDRHRRAITHATERRDERLGRFRVRLLQKAQRVIPTFAAMSRAAFTDSGAFGIRADEIEQFLLKTRQVEPLDQATNSGLPITGFKSESSRALASGLEAMVSRSSNAVEARAVSASALRKMVKAAAETSSRGS
jgi:hypothetical protein